MQSLSRSSQEKKKKRETCNKENLCKALYSCMLWILSKKRAKKILVFLRLHLKQLFIRSWLVLKQTEKRVTSRLQVSFWSCIDARASHLTHSQHLKVAMRTTNSSGSFKRRCDIIVYFSNTASSEIRGGLSDRKSNGWKRCEWTFTRTSK